MRHAVARNPDHHQRAPQPLDHERRDEAAAVAADIDNECVLADLRKVKLRKLVQPGSAHVRDVEVSNFAAGFFRDVVDVLLHPIEIVKRCFVIDGHDGHIARPGIGRLGIHAQDYLFACSADERVIKVWQARHRRVVDRENVIARFHVYADIRERRARVLVPIFAR